MYSDIEMRYGHAIKSLFNRHGLEMTMQLIKTMFPCDEVRQGMIRMFEAIYNMEVK